jgi:quercetin dioxygenase-like cupin family protein
MKPRGLLYVFRNALFIFQRRKAMIRNRCYSPLFALIVICVVLMNFILLNANAQAPGIKAKPLLRTTLSGDDKKEVFIMSVEFAPGSSMPSHTHPGDNYEVLLEGTLELNAEGRETRRVSAGEAYHNPRGLVHGARNIGDTPARTVVVFVVDKGQLIVQPATK